MAVEEGDPRRVEILASASPFDRATEVLALIERPSVTRAADPAALHMLGRAAACVGAFTQAQTLCTASAQPLREQGRLAQLAQVLALSSLVGAASRRVGRLVHRRR